MNERRVLRIVFGVLIAGVVGLGLWLSGGPGHNRLLRADQGTRAGLENAAQLVQGHFEREGALPESLEAARRSCAETPSAWCPEFAGADYAYRLLEGERRFEICSDFALPAPPSAPFEHPAGRFCRPFTAEPQT